MPRMIDAHCHLEYMPATVVDEARKTMTAIITSVAKPSDAERMLALHDANKDFVFLALGFHPDEIVRHTEAEIDAYLDLIRTNAERIISVGEVGLDYHWIKTLADQARSKALFGRFIDLARDLGLPLTIHSRNSQTKNEHGKDDAIGEAIEMLTLANAKNVMLHCFSGSQADLQAALDRGWYISFATLVVRSKKHQKLAAATPLDRMLLETDAPWLDPAGPELTNRPWNIEQSAAVIAALHGTTRDMVLEQTAANAVELFGLRIS